MSRIAHFINDRIAALFSDESAQDGIEYLLVIGGVSVAIVAAIIAAPSLISSTITQVEALISGVLS